MSLPIQPDPADPLHPLHLQAEAELQPYGPFEIVTTFGQPQVEYAAIRKACAMMDLPQRGLIELTGRDRLAFLNNLLTNQTWDKGAKSGLTAGGGVYAFFLNLKGRIVADVNVIERGDRTLLEVDRRLVGELVTAFDKFLFSEQVKMASRIRELHEIVLHGPGASAILDAAAGQHVVELAPSHSTATTLFGVEVTVWRDDPCGVPGLHLIMPAGEARKVWMNLLSKFGETVEHGRRPLRAAGWAAFNTVRIEAGRSLFGIDFDDSVLPAELGPATFARAVSVTKGCYLGQEVVARMHARKQVARQLCGLKLADDALPIAQSQIFNEAGEVIGGVTSSTPSPILSGAAIALGYLKKPFFAEGTKVKVPAEGQLREATVVATPFV